MIRGSKGVCRDLEGSLAQESTIKWKRIWQMTWILGVNKFFTGMLKL